MEGEAEEVLLFWFGAPDGPEAGKPREIWFRSSPAFDEEIRSRFGPLHERAMRAELDSWKETPRGSLALLILLDQFSRNLYREGPKAYAADSQALQVAEHALSRRFDQQLLPVERSFIYLPLEHSEDRTNQRRSVELFTALPEGASRDELVDFAERHRRVVERFGRFPHRNMDLGRPSTPEELEFLAGPDAPF